MPEGLPQHLDPKHPGVDAAGVHRDHQQDKDQGGGEEKRAVDAHSNDRQDASSSRNKQVPADKQPPRRNLFVSP